jgi:cholesterol oxidase
MHRFADKVNGTAGNGLIEVLFNTSTTAHIMGGCPMGETINEGVVNPEFKVFGYPDMYVLDGSIIPCNLGVNPSLTITTLSEYAMSCIPAKQGVERKTLEEMMAEKA